MTTTIPDTGRARPRPRAGPGPSPAAGRLRRWTATLVRAAAWLLWHLAGAWVTLGLCYTAPGPVWLRCALGAAAMTTFVVAWRRGSRGRRAGAGGGRWIIAAVTIGVAYAAYHFALLEPQRQQEWAADQAIMPQVQIDGALVRVRNARRFAWLSETAFSPAYYDAVYDVDKLQSMHYAVASFSKTGGLAHVFLCFAFADGQHVAISVEARRRKGQEYQPVASLFRQYQLMYVVGDERDIVGLRGVANKGRVQLYPARTTPSRRRAIFLDMMRRAGALEAHPEFYDLATSNCMNNIVWHLRRLDDDHDVDDAGARSGSGSGSASGSGAAALRKRPIPNELQLILTGFSDRVAYDLGYLDTDLPFAQARQMFRIDQRIRRNLHDEKFSQLIRAPAAPAAPAPAAVE